MLLYEQELIKVSYLSCQVWWPQAVCQWRYNLFSLSQDLDMITSPATACLVSFESKPVNVLAWQIWCSQVLQKWGYQFLYQFLHECLGRNLNPPPRSAILRNFKIRKTDLQLHVPDTADIKTRRERTQSKAIDSVLTRGGYGSLKTRILVYFMANSLKRALKSSQKVSPRSSR